MQLDVASFLRLDAPQSLGTTGSGGSFATSTGDVLEVTCYGPGVFRLRTGPNTRPDYGLVTGRAKACTTARREDGSWAFTAGDSTLEIATGALAFRLSRGDAPVLRSITDEVFDGRTRWPAFGRRRQGGQWAAALALASGEAVYGLGEKFGPLDKRGQLVHSQVTEAGGVNTGLAHKNAPFAWSPGAGKGAWGVFVNTPAMVVHGVGHPDWSHRSYVLLVDDEALDLFLFAAETPAGILDRYAQLTGRPAGVPPWSLGLWVSPENCRTPAEVADFAARLRERRIPCDVLLLDGRATWRESHCFDFGWDPERFPDPRAALAAIKAHALRVGVWECPYVSVDSPLFEDLAARQFLLRTADGATCVLGEDEAAAADSPDDAVAPHGIVDFTHPGAYAWWRDAHERLFADGADVISCDRGELVPDDAVAFNGDSGRRLHNVYPLLYNQCAFDATAKFQRRDDAPPVVRGRAAWTASQRCPVQWAGEAQSDWEGLAASVRGALSWGMSGAPCHGADVGGFYGSQPAGAELFVRWLQFAVFASHLRVTGCGEREPWAFGGETEAVVRKWLAFRYRLVPYLQRVVAEAVATGMPVMRAMPLAFPGNPLVRNCESQFLCGDTLFVAPVLQEGGEVTITLPPGAWYDLNSRQRFPGQRVLRYRAKLDQFPVFGREGAVLPLGRAVQHMGEIDAATPLEQLWVFGRPVAPLEGFTQARIVPDATGTHAIHAEPDVKVELFGDAAGMPVHRLPR
jgi:alpha-D-xyloside xylohydrolase